MAVCELCSFSENAPQTQNENLTSVVRVMLGFSESVHDVDLALREGPVLFLSYLSGVELPAVVAAVVVERANDMHSAFAISSTEISELVRHYLEFSFHTSATDRIGAREAYNFQRLVYNVAACVVASYESELAHGHGNKELHLDALRRATELVAIFANSVKEWMPVSPWFDGWWTKWHVLAYVLETTAGTVLSEGNQKWNRLSFLVFCDSIAEHALDERDKMPTNCITDYKSSPFAWTSCSKAWTSVLGSCSAGSLTPNAAIFLQIADTIFNSPLAPPSRPVSPKHSPNLAEVVNDKKRRYNSPVSERKKATSSAIFHGSGVLTLDF